MTERERERQKESGSTERERERERGRERDRDRERERQREREIQLTEPPPFGVYNIKLLQRTLLKAYRQLCGRQLSGSWIGGEEEMLKKKKWRKKLMS